MSRDDHLEVRLERLAGFVAVLEAPGFVAAEYGTTELEAGVWVIPYPHYHPEVNRFVSLAYEDGWVRTDFDWGVWSTTQEAHTLRDDPEALAAATPDQLAKLITVLVRQERFSEGSLMWAFEDGLVLAIVRRAWVLAGQAKC